MRLKIKSRSLLNISEFKELNRMISKEMIHQFDKFGVQNHSFEVWFMILMEEVAEICQNYIAFKFDGKDFQTVKREMIQSITLLVQMLFGKYNDK